VILAGEPGIGKTRIAQELARRAQEHKANVLWGWCYEPEGATSYWPWVDSLRTYVQATEPVLLRRQSGSGAAAVGKMIPEILTALDGVEAASAMNPDQARFRLFDSITGFLKRASGGSPVSVLTRWSDMTRKLASVPTMYWQGRVASSYSCS